MPSALSPEQRRRNVQRVRDAAARLSKAENAMQDLLARLPAIAGELGEIRTEIEDALAAAKGEDDDDDPE